MTLTAPDNGIGYVCPIYPDGIWSSDLRRKPPEHQAAVALHWFNINFITRQQDERNRSGVLGVGILGQMILGSDNALTLNGDALTFGGEQLTFGGVKDGAEERRKAGASTALLTTARAELELEFSEAVDREIVSVVGAHFEQQSAEWVFVPLPDPLPIELDDVGRLQSEVDAVIVCRDAEALEAHLETVPNTPPARGQNYWPGAELLDEGLRDEIKEAARDIRELAASRDAQPEPVAKAIGRLTQARTKLGQWIAEGAVKGLAGDLAKALVTLASVSWWDTVFHLLTQIVQSAGRLLGSLLGG